MKLKVKEDWLVFARGITIKEVNPESYALKTPYADNIFGTCLSTLPIIDKLVEGIKIVKGFEARAKILSNKQEKRLNKYEYAHSEGNALKITWKNFDTERALFVAKEIFKINTKGNIHLIIYDNELGIYRDLDSRKILRYVPEDNKHRTLISE